MDPDTMEPHGREIDAESDLGDPSSVARQHQLELQLQRTMDCNGLSAKWRLQLQRPL